MNWSKAFLKNGSVRAEEILRAVRNQATKSKQLVHLPRHRNGEQQAGKAIARHQRALISPLDHGGTNEILKLTPSAQGFVRIRRAQDGPYAFGTVNVENYFPEGVGSLGDRVRPLKTAQEVKALGRAFGQLDADIVGVQEVFSGATLRNFIERELPDAGYQTLVVTLGNDSRGINLGLMSRFSIKRVLAHTDLPVYLPGRQAPERLSRNLLQATVAAPGGDVEVFVIHLKSMHLAPKAAIAAEAQKLGLPIAVVEKQKLDKAILRQEAEALAVRKYIKEFLEMNPDARVALIGDANNIPGSKTVRTLLGEFDQGPKFSATVAENLGPNTPTHRSPGGFTSSIDHLDLSPNLRAQLVPGSVSVIQTPDAIASTDHNPVKAIVDPKRNILRVLGSFVKDAKAS